jgi:hypothetical protein
MTIDAIHQAGLQTARVEQVDGSHVQARLLDQDALCWAQLAVPYAIAPGQDVLLAGNEDDAFYVIGVLSAPASPREWELPGGARAVCAGAGEEQTVELHSGDGRLLMEYNVKAKKTRVHVTEGDLEFVTSNGDIRFVSGGDISLTAKQGVAVQAAKYVELSAAAMESQTTTSLSLQPSLARVSASHTVVATETLDVATRRTTLTSKQFAGHFAHARLYFQTLEQIAGTVIQKARNVYQTVAELCQLKAGRTRTVVETSIHQKSETVVTKAEGDIKIDGKQIHLG